MALKFDRNLIPPAPDLSFEIPLWEGGILRVAGIDEAGRGALAGPVSAGAIILDPDVSLVEKLNGVRDSKEMTPDQRAYWESRLKIEAAAWGVGFATHEEIDALGIVPATCLAAARAVDRLQIPAEYLLIDYIKLADCLLPQTSLIKGDARSLSIAAASVLAKTTRDALMLSLDAVYPGYGFAKHKGYATAAHYAALERLGPSEIHRRSFKLVREQGIGNRAISDQ